MSDEPHRSTEIDDLLKSMAPDDPAYPPPGTSGGFSGAGANGGVAAGMVDGDTDFMEFTDEELDDEADARTPAKRKHGNLLTEWMIVIAVAVTAALLVRAFVLQQFAVQGSSMYSTLHDGDRVLVNKLSYRMHDPRRGDVVVLKTIEALGDERDLIKRVVGLPGETLEYTGCVLYIDGRELVEPYLDPAVLTGGCGESQEPITIPEGFVFVMGDNRGGSKDSRALDPIAYSDLIGRAFVVIWPFGDWQWL
ncbi:MAG: signal peptidase I [Actinomycetota bacterium]|nr:signal peptidase I [Actinomycetota bacterium]